MASRKLIVGGATHVVPVRPTEAARIGRGYSGERRASVIKVEFTENGDEIVAQVAAPLRGRGERGAQQDDAEIGVLPDRRAGDGRPPRARATPTRAPARAMAGALTRALSLEIADGHAMTSGMMMHVTGFQRLKLGKAGAI